MNDYFSATEVHLDDKCLMDAAEAAEYPTVATLGVDNMIYCFKTTTNEEVRYNLDQ